MNKVLVILFSLGLFIPTHLTYAEKMGSNTLQSQVYILKPGDTLWDISQTRYGNRHYSAIVMTHNNIEDPNSLVAGLVIKLPDLDTLMENEGVNRMAKEEMELILSANTLFISNERVLFQARRGKRSQQPLKIPDATNKDLVLAADKIDQAIKSLSNVSLEGRKVPKSLILQLSNIPSELRKLANGSNDGYGYDLDMVQQRMIRAINNSIHWSREGFQ